MPADELFLSLDEGDLDEVAAAVAADPALAASRDDLGVSLLMAALYRGHAALAAELAEHLPRLEVWEAAALGRAWDLDLEALDQRSPDGFSPLHLAANFGHVATMQRLLDAGADVEAEAQNVSRVRPLHAAAAGRSTGAVQLLLERGARADAPQHGGWTALMAACLHRLPEMARLLVEAGADPQQRAEDGRTARSMLPEGEDPLAYGLGL